MKNMSVVTPSDKQRWFEEMSIWRREKLATGRPAPQVLYKYKKYDKYTKEIFAARKVYFSQPKFFNDIFDSQIPEYRKPTHEEIIQWSGGRESLPEAIRNWSAERICQHARYPTHEEWERVRDRAFNRNGILCLTEEKENILMWSHYADRNKGFVLGFDRRFDPDFFNETFPVFYQSEFPQVCCLENGAKYIMDSMLTKSSLWEYEKEFRILKPKHGVYQFKKEALVEVVLGYNISKREQNNILRWVSIDSFPNVKIKKIRKSRMGFILEAVDL